jgi:hypothetical protein
MVRCSGYLGGDVREGLRAAAIALLAPQIQRTEARIRAAHPDDDDAMDAIALLASGLGCEISALGGRCSSLTRSYQRHFGPTAGSRSTSYAAMS